MGLQGGKRGRGEGGGCRVESPATEEVLALRGCVVVVMMVMVLCGESSCRQREATDSSTEEGRGAVTVGAAMHCVTCTLAGRRPHG